MKNKYITLYKAPYGVVKGMLKDEMTFEEAEKLGKDYCQEKGFGYVGTYTEDTVEQAHEEVIQGIR
ncbi:hypothetical protein CVD28_00390 [Bacillus sp. M6-12]|uniref:hypothetical protein n=1 Tax=Bacillus sp. M6-12 TaxID=2054166 RepID=UPI000C771437|nr:hypothetical protein [Bacillus sp. M6-12]PLS18893.1 hypothetical protein CVD28_00390 [Bacillus sp. M6-12]